MYRNSKIKILFHPRRIKEGRDFMENIILLWDLNNEYVSID